MSSNVSQDVSRPGGFANRYAAGNAQSVVPDLNRQHLLIGSLPKVGKSMLLGDNPDAFIFNFDFSTFLPKTRAAIWPIRGNDGFAYESGPNGLKKIKTPTFEDYLAVRDDLLAMAAANKPRPKMVVVDTISKMCEIVQEYQVRKSGKTDFKQLGQDGWAERNRIIEGFGRTIYSAGYGLAEIIHIAPKYIPVMNQQTGETVNVKEILPTISNGLWNALFTGPSLIASVELKKVSKVVNGKAQSHPIRVLKVAKNVLDAQTGGTRIPLPDEIELSSEHPWDSLRSEFDKAIASL